MATSDILRKLQSTLWSSDSNNLDPDKDRDYIIHQTLAYGDLDDILLLYSLYPKQIIATVFSTKPYKDYRKSRFYFVKDFIVHKRGALPEANYVKNTPRAI